MRRSVKDLRINQEIVRTLFYYTEDGNLYRKNSRHKSKFPVAFKQKSDKKVRINNWVYLVHRIIFLYHKGYLPAQVDHADLNQNNNRIENLRDATHNQNMWNRTKNKNNTTGYKGVHFCKITNKWRANIMAHRKKIELGRYKTKEEASAAYKAASKIYHGEFSRS